MCGISGIWRPKGLTTLDYHKSKSSIQRLSTRGPDFQSTKSINNDLLFNHARLSILDLTSTSNQPIYSSCGRYLLAFNGEIYNFKQIALSLDQYESRYRLFSNKLRLCSDTISILDSLSVFGVFPTLNRLNGMFSISVYDCLDKILYLARDYYGQKPLYYHLDYDSLAFSSDLIDTKSFLDKTPALCKEASYQYIEYGMSLSPQSLYCSIFEVAPNYFVTFSLPSRSTLVKSFSYVHDDSIITQNKPNLSEAMDCIILDHLHSDVPSALLLSGGIDSTLLAGLSAKNSSDSISCFTFYQSNDSEVRLAKKTAHDFSLPHYIISPEPEHFSDLISHSLSTVDVPISDPATFSSLYMHTKVKELGFKVLLNGDGADEIFSGYSRHFSSYKPLHRLPSKLVAFLSNLYSQYQHLFPQKTSFVKYIRYLLSDTRGVAYLSRLAESPLYLNTQPVLEMFLESRSSLDLLHSNPNLIDIFSFLPSKMLVKSDRSSMNVGVEARSPYLDLRLCPYSSIFPNQRKMYLKQLLSDIYPTYPIELPKSGFEFDFSFLNQLPVFDFLASPFVSDIFDYLDINPLYNHSLFQKPFNRSNWNLVSFLCWSQFNL